MDYLTVLPPELLDQVLSHLRHCLVLAAASVSSPSRSASLSLPPGSSSPLPLSASHLGLVSLASTNRHLHHHVSPSVHSFVHLDSIAKAKAFLSGCKRLPTILRMPRPISAESSAPPSLITPQELQQWPDECLHNILSSSLLRNIEELHLAGVPSSADSLRDLSAMASACRPEQADRPRDDDNGLGNTIDYEETGGLRSLTIDFEGASPTSADRHALSGRAEPSFEANAGVETKDSSDPFHVQTDADNPFTSSPCPLLSLLALSSPSLEHVSISHFSFGPVPTSPSSSRLRRVSLSHCNVSDATLSYLLGGSQVESLELDSCTSFSRKGLVDVVRRYGRRIKSLRIDSSTPLVSIASNPTRSSSPRPALLPPSPTPSSRRVPSVHHPLLHILDDLLPYTPHLVQLEMVGPFASSFLNLVALVPGLRSFSIAQCTTWSTPDALLPLIATGPSRLPELRQIQVNRRSPACRGCGVDDAATDQGSATRLEEVWGAARSHSVELSGDIFEVVEERMQWANEMVLNELGHCLVKEPEGGLTRDPEPQQPRRRFKRPSLT